MCFSSPNLTKQQLTQISVSAEMQLKFFVLLQKLNKIELHKVLPSVISDVAQDCRRPAAKRRKGGSRNVRERHHLLQRHRRIHHHFCQQYPVAGQSCMAGWKPAFEFVARVSPDVCEVCITLVVRVKLGKSNLECTRQLRNSTLREK